MANRVRFQKNRRLVGITQAARYVGVSRWTIYAWIRIGKILFYKLPATTKDPEKGGRWILKVDLDDLDELLRRSADRN
jgi:predicted DNA-binding transcriptional regulator AlpA